MQKKLTSDVIKTLPYDYAKSEKCIFIQESVGYVLYVTQKVSSFVFAEVLRYVAVPFQLKLCNLEEFNAFLTKHYNQEDSTNVLSEELSDSFDLQSFANTIAPTQDLLSEQHDAPIIKLINGVISQAIRKQVSDIHFEPYETKFVIRFRIDGILREVITQDVRMSAPIISRLKILSRLDISERRLPQDGRVSLSLGDKTVDVRVSSLPSSYGERIVLRILDKQAAQIDIEQLGFATHLLSDYKQALKQSEGIILVTGPTGSGKTTTLYAGLNFLSDSSQNILTVEDPIEYTLNGIGQTQVNQKVGYVFSKGLKAILRQDPDVVMVGEIRDEETARIAIQASLTGHLVLSTVHTNSAIGAITRLKDMQIESFLLASSLKGIMAQRLVRRLCTCCKISHKLTHAQAVYLNLKRSDSIYKAKGCSVCDFTGYSGRIGLAEYIVIDDFLKGLIHDNASEKKISEYAFKHRACIEKNSIQTVVSGVTSFEELLRLNVVSNDADLSI